MLALLSLAPSIVALLGGIWAIQRVRRPDIRARADRSTGIRVALAVALIGGVLAAGLIGLAGMMFSEAHQSPLLAVPFGSVAGGVLGLAAIFGYALLARPRVGAVAVAGSMIGPVVLISGTLLTTSIASTIELGPLRRAVEQHDTEVAAPSAAIHVTAEAPTVETARGGAVISVVNLRIRLTADVPITLETEDPAPCFTLFPPDREAAMYLQTCARPGSPTTFRPARSYVYETWLRYPLALIDATQGTYRAGPPGTWTLRVDFLDAAGAEYDVSLPMELR